MCDSAYFLRNQNFWTVEERGMTSKKWNQHGQDEADNDTEEVMVIPWTCHNMFGGFRFSNLVHFLTPLQAVPTTRNLHACKVCVLIS